MRLDATDKRALDVVGFKDLKLFAQADTKSHAGKAAIVPSSSPNAPFRESSEVGGRERDVRGINTLRD